MVVAAALDVNALRDRIADVVALVRVLEADARARCLASDDVEGDADRRALPEAGAEVGVESPARADRGDHRRGVARYGQAVDALVPRVRPGKDGAAGRAGDAQRVRRAARASESEQRDDSGGDAGSHASSIGIDTSISDPSLQVPEDLLPAASLLANSAPMCDAFAPKV